MIEKREKICLYYQPIDGREATKNEIEKLANYLKKMVTDNDFKNGMFSFDIIK